MPHRDPDEGIVATFKILALKNEDLSNREGRDIYEDTEQVEMRSAGSKEVKVQPALAMSHWETDPETGSQRKITYAERFSHQYRQFKARQQQTKVGTPLDMVYFLTESKRAELRAQNVYTVEALAAVDGAELKNLGVGGRELKNQATEFIENAKSGAGDKMLRAELDALKIRNQLLEEDLENRKQKDGAEPEYLAGMSNQEIKDYIAANTGQTPLGNPNRKTLVRMAMDCRPDKNERVA